MAEYLIYGDIGANLDGVDASHVVRELDAFRSEPLTVRINSYGGDVGEGIAIYNAIRRRNETTVIVDGLAVSIASVIAMAGTTVLMEPGSQMMIHDARDFLFGGYTAGELMAKAAGIESTNESIRDIYVRKTGESPEAISQLMAAETWFTAAEAVEIGLATEALSGTADVDVSTVRAAFSQKIAAWGKPREPKKRTSSLEKFKQALNRGV